MSQLGSEPEGKRNEEGCYRGPDIFLSGFRSTGSNPSTTLLHRGCTVMHGAGQGMQGRNASHAPLIIASRWGRAKAPRRSASRDNRTDRETRGTHRALLLPAFPIPLPQIVAVSCSHRPFGLEFSCDRPQHDPLP